MEFNGTFFVTIITFVLFVVIMNKILYAPILDIMEKRKEYIDSNYNNAKNNNIKAEELTKERQNKLNEAEKNAKVEYSNIIDNYKAERDDKINLLKETEKNNLNLSVLDLKKVSDEAKDRLKESMTDFASDISSKILGYKTDVQGFDNEQVSEILWGNLK